MRILSHRRIGTAVMLALLALQLGVPVYPACATAVEGAPIELSENEGNPNESTQDPSQTIVLGEEPPSGGEAVEVQDTSGTLASGSILVSNLDATNELIIPNRTNGSEGSRYLEVSVNDPDGRSGTLTVASSDSSVAAVADYASTNVYYGSAWSYPTITAKSVGTATITVTFQPNDVGEGLPPAETLSFKVICYPDSSSVTDVTVSKASNTKVHVTWNSTKGATGYRIVSESYDYDASQWVYKILKTVTGETSTYADVAAPWGESVNYTVIPYLKYGDTVYSTPTSMGEGAHFYYTLDYPANAKPTVAKSSYNKVCVSWKKKGGVAGYKVYRAPADEWGYAKSEFKVLVTIKSADTTSTVVKATWKKNYLYAVRPYISYNGKEYVSAPYAYDTHCTQFALPKPTVRITSIAKASAKSLKVTWKAQKGATSFEVYRSTTANSGFSCVKKPKAGATSCEVKATPGTIYYFEVAAVYGTTGTVTSRVVAQQIPISASGTATKAKSVAVSGLGQWYGAYGVYTYAQGSRTYVAYLNNRTLTVLGYDKKQKQVYKKAVKLDAYEMFAGIYHGPDNNNYVVTGSSNYNESKKKVVIRVTKYSNTWVKDKVATIKGGAANVYEGIYSPFRASSIALDMQGTTLYLETGRTMFQTSDGLHHQSNIGFSINTTTMKATVSNISYASHSFGQQVRFKDGTLYVADHGDAYPRAMALTWQEGYGTKAAGSVQRVNAFEIVGETGNNYTGATLGGMEVSDTTVLLCGASVPQNYAVKGVTGADWSYQQNLYVTVTNRTTGKTTVKWLTTYHPKKKVGVGNVSMVKLSDQRFGILYNVSNNGKATVHYMVIDANGKKVFDRTISGAMLSTGSSPVYASGRVSWAACDANYRGRLYSIQAL